jgi:hypothetical protein
MVQEPNRPIYFNGRQASIPSSNFSICVREPRALQHRRREMGRPSLIVLRFVPVIVCKFLSRRTQTYKISANGSDQHTDRDLGLSLAGFPRILLHCSRSRQGAFLICISRLLKSQSTFVKLSSSIPHSPLLKFRPKISECILVSWVSFAAPCFLFRRTPHRQNPGVSNLDGDQRPRCAKKALAKLRIHDQFLATFQLFLAAASQYQQYQSEFHPVIDRTVRSLHGLDATPEVRVILIVGVPLPAYPSHQS